MRGLYAMLCMLGWAVVAAAAVAPLGGLSVAADRIAGGSREPVIIASQGQLFLHSILQAGVAAGAGLLLAAGPAGWWCMTGGTCRWICGTLGLAGLLLPPQVYAYAWDVATAAGGWLHGWLPGKATASPVGSALRAGLISAAWLWPLAAMVLSAGWQQAGRGIYQLAVLDASPVRAWLRAVLPALRPYLVAAAALIALISLIEYAIPHLCLARVYSTELLLLVDAGAPPAQVARTAVVPLVLVIVLAFLAGRQAGRFGGTSSAQAHEEPAPSPRAGPVAGGERPLFVVATLVWGLTIAAPLAFLAGSMRRMSAWPEAWRFFGEEWSATLIASGLAAVFSLAVAVGTVFAAEAWRRPGLLAGAWLCAAVALVPSAALGLGFIQAYNRPGPAGWLYDRTPVVWALGLTARFAVVLLAVLWLTGRHHLETLVELARGDGAGGLEIIGRVLVPLSAPALLAGALVVLLLGQFEVVVTHLAGPVGFPGIALTILSLMHYGRDDLVIAISLTFCGAGLLVAAVCGKMAGRRHR